MNARPSPRGLGRGLSALIADIKTTPAEPEGAAGAPRSLAVDRLHPGKYQPRRRFDEAALEALASSVREQGVLQPLLVRPHPTRANDYEIIAGERRWRAAQRARLHEVPVLIRELDDRQTLEIALVENVQREDLSPLEEAEAYRRLIEEFQHTQEALAGSVGKSRSHIANMLRLLSLPDSVRGMIEAGSLTAGHARALVTAADPEALAKQVVARGLSVRDTERLAGQGKSSAARSKGGRKRPPASADIVALEHDLSLELGLTVAVRQSGNGGELTIAYRTLEQLEEVIKRLMRAG